MITDITSLLFVCTGNTCRSPMAEYMAKELFGKINSELKIGSRGIHAGSEKFIGATIDSVKAVREFYPQNQIWLFHQPRQLTIRDVYETDLILTMTEDHRETIVSEASDFIPNVRKKVFSLKEYSGVWPKSKIDFMDVADPFGGKKYDSLSGIRESYLIARDQILACLEGIATGNLPTFEEIQKERKERNSARIEHETERLIDVYDAVRRIIEKTERGKTIELTYEEYDGIVLGKSKYSRSQKVADLVERLAKSKGITLREKKVKKGSQEFDYEFDDRDDGTNLGPKITKPFSLLKP